MLKAASEAPLQRSFEESWWSTSWHKKPGATQPHESLNAAWDESYEVLLIAAVSGTRRFQAYGRMASRVDPHGARPQGHPLAWLPPFRVEWLRRIERWARGVPFSPVADGVNALDAFRHTVAQAGNCQEIDAASGAAIVAAIDAVCDEDARQAAAADAARVRFFEGEGDAESLWDGFLARLSSVGDVLYACHTGSRAYGLHTPESDSDLLAIAAFGPRALLCSPRAPRESFRNDDGRKPDFSVLEVRRFCSLLLAGESHSVETLFHPPPTTTAEAQSPAVFAAQEVWNALVEMRGAFVTLALAKSYLSELDGPKGLRKLAARRAKGTPTEALLARKLCYVLLRQAELGRRAVAALSDGSEGFSFSPIFPPGSPAHTDIMAVRGCDVSRLEELSQRIQRERDELAVAISNAGSGCSTLVAPAVAERLVWWHDTIRAKQLEEFSSGSPPTLASPLLPEEAPEIVRLTLEALRSIGARVLLVVSPPPARFRCGCGAAKCPCSCVAIYAMPPSALLSLRPPTEPQLPVGAHAFEAGRLCQLAATDNPNAFSLISDDRDDASFFRLSGEEWTALSSRTADICTAATARRSHFSTGGSRSKAPQTSAPSPIVADPESVRRDHVLEEWLLLVRFGSAVHHQATASLLPQKPLQ